MSASGLNHHVFIKRGGDEQLQALFVDLTESQLKRRFVSPYRHGKAVLLEDHSVVQTKDILAVKIRVTALGSEEILRGLEEEYDRHTEEMNRLGGVLVIGFRSWSNHDLSDQGEDVTSVFITSAPGEKTVGRILGNWMADNLGKAIIGVAGAVAIAVVLTWLGLKK